MKRVLFLILICLVLLPLTAQAQKKRSTSKKTTTATQPVPSVEVRAGATRVADQIKVLSRFLFLLGAVSKGFEAADAAALRGEASTAAIEQTQKSKATVRESLKNVREALDQLEVDFRMKPELQRFYTKLAGSAAGAATAEDQAAANQFDKSGRSLLLVVNRLTDVLVEMR